MRHGNSPGLPIAVLLLQLLRVRCLQRIPRLLPPVHGPWIARGRATAARVASGTSGDTGATAAAQAAHKDGGPSQLRVQAARPACGHHLHTPCALAQRWKQRQCALSHLLAGRPTLGDCAGATNACCWSLEAERRCLGPTVLQVETQPAPKQLVVSDARVRVRVAIRALEGRGEAQVHRAPCCAGPAFTFALRSAPCSIASVLTRSRRILGAAPRVSRSPPLKLGGPSSPRAAPTDQAAPTHCRPHTQQSVVGITSKMAAKQLSARKRQAEGQGGGGKQRRMSDCFDQAKPVRASQGRLAACPAPSAAAWRELLLRAATPAACPHSHLPAPLCPLLRLPQTTRSAQKPSSELVRLLGSKDAAAQAAKSSGRPSRGLGGLDGGRHLRSREPTPAAAPAPKTAAAKAKSAPKAAAKAAAKGGKAAAGGRGGKGSQQAAAKAQGRRRQLSEATLDGETFHVGDAVYVVLDTEAVAGLE